MATPTNLPATAVSGQILTAEYVNNLRGAFRILQVVSNTPYTTETDNSTTSYADTGVTATITPQSADSKILVYVVHGSCRKNETSASNALKMQLHRKIGAGAFSSVQQIADGQGATGTAVALIFNVNGVLLDSPATTSAVTYKTMFANATASAVVTVQRNAVPSTIILMEISA